MYMPMCVLFICTCTWYATYVNTVALRSRYSCIPVQMHTHLFGTSLSAQVKAGVGAVELPATLPAAGDSHSGDLIWL